VNDVPSSSGERDTRNLTRSTLVGLQWAYLGTAAGAVLQFGMTAIMARLLTPAAFGLVALAGLFLRFVTYFAKAGISQALIQKHHLSDRDIRAAFSLSAALSMGFGILVFALAPFAAQVAQEPALTPVLQLLTVGLVLQGLSAPSFALLRRELRFKDLSIIEIGSYTIGYVGVGLTMALMNRGVYALVGAMLTHAVVSTISAYLLVRHPVLPTRAIESYRSVLSFGARISVVGFFEFLQSNLDTLAVGRWAGATQLGLYNRAKLLAELPSYHLMSGLSQVLFPSFSAIQRESERLFAAYRTAVGSAAAIVLPLNAGMAVAAPEIVMVLLGPQWDGAIPVMPWLLLASSVALLGHFAGVVAEAQAALNAKILVAIAATASLALLLVFAEGRALAAFGAAVAASAVVSHAGYVTILRRTLGKSYRDLLSPYGRSLIAAALVGAAIAAARAGMLLTGAPLAAVLGVEIFVGGVTLVGLLRGGVLQPARFEFARRLAASGMTDSEAGRIGRVLKAVVGTPPTTLP
jgi:lipopolysaccharide exporter